MEINKSLLRKNAWQALKGIYWFMFLACLVAGLVGVGGSKINFSMYFHPSAGVETEGLLKFDGNLNPKAVIDTFKNPDIYVLTVLLAAVVTFIVIVLVLALLFKVFISGPAEVSFAKLKLAAVVDRDKDANLAFFGFKNGYIRIVKTIFRKNLFLFLWGLLPLIGILPAVGLAFSAAAGGNELMLAGAALGCMSLGLVLCIPAAVKSFAYLLVPYIVAENPAIGGKEAIRRSCELMDGVKWQTFLLKLSFIGWYFLGALCCGVGLLFVEPYYQAAETLLYTEIRGRAEAEAVAGEIEASIIE